MVVGIQEVEFGKMYQSYRRQLIHQYQLYYLSVSIRI